MAVNLSPFGPRPQFELSSGLPAVGNKLFFYVAGSVNTKQNTYTDSTGAVANTNPIILDALGQPTNTQIWFTAGQSYKVVYAPSTDTDPPTSPIWTVDNLVGINDTGSTLDQWVASGVTPTFVSATQFTVPGDQTSAFAVGRRVKCTVTAGTVYGRISASVFAALTTVTVVLDSGALDSGLSAVQLGLLTPDNSSIPGVKLAAGEWTFSNGLIVGSASGVLQIPDGTVAAPGLRVASSSTTGIFSSADNSLRVATNGAEAGRFSGQNLSLGGIAAGSRLHVKQSANTAAGGIKVERSDNTNNYSLYIGGDNKLYLDGTGAGLGYVVFNGLDIQPNGVSLPIQKSYTSADQTITSAGTLTLAHGLGAAPKIIMLSIINQVTEGGWAVGEEVFIYAGIMPGTNVGLGVRGDATNVFIAFGAAANAISGMSTGGGSMVLTNTSWRLRVRAYA